IARGRQRAEGKAQAGLPQVRQVAKPRGKAGPLRFGRPLPPETRARPRPPLTHFTGKPMAIDNESFELLLASIQRFVRERLVPAEDAGEEHDEVPADIVEDMKEMGLFGLSIPEQYGGIGLSMSQECRVAYEI